MTKPTRQDYARATWSVVGFFVKFLVGIGLGAVAIVLLGRWSVWALGAALVLLFLALIASAVIDEARERAYRRHGP